MGCWNETCLLSRLPIACGQAIACVFIAPVDGTPDTVYPDGQYVPLSLPFFGRYDDYGRIECTAYDEAALDSLSNTVLWTIKNGDKTPVKPPMPDDKDWDYKLTDLSDMARHGRLLVENGAHKNGCAPVRLAFFHRDLWDYAVSQTGRFITANDAMSQHGHWPAAKGIGKGNIAGKYALTQLAAINAAMETMRVAWQPTCGTGSQTCIEYPWQVKMYRKFADRADAFYQSSRMED